MPTSSRSESALSAYRPARSTTWRAAGVAWVVLAAITLAATALHEPWLWMPVLVWAVLGVVLGLGLLRRMDRLRGQVADQAARLDMALERIDSLATRDELTQVWNRRHLTELIGQHLAAARRSGAPLCLGLLDLDQFARFNERFGRHVGDELLRRFAATAQKSVRNADFLGRVGGDEFLIVFPASLQTEAQVGLERLRSALATLPLGDLAPGVALSFSAGLVRVTPTETLEAAIARADQALGKAAAAGRNRVEVA
jgi:diguanylate cyclase (GGDEF)-like protein